MEGTRVKKVCVIWPRWCSILLKCSNMPSRLKIDICKKCEKFSSKWWQKSFFLSQNRNWKQLWHPKHLPLTLIKCAIFLNPRFIIFMFRISIEIFFFNFYIFFINFFCHFYFLSESNRTFTLRGEIYASHPLAYKLQDRMKSQLEKN